MKSSRHVAALRPGADPFEERQSREKTLITHALGCEFRFIANDVRLLRIVAQAYKNLPTETAANRRRINVVLRLGRERPRRARSLGSEPPPLHLHSGAGWLCGSIDANNFAVVAPEQAQGWVSISRAMLEYPYHLRYELIEFVVHVLAARVRRLTPLHAACIGRGRRGVLVIGASGAGKSTLALHCMRAGFDFLAEDSVLVAPRNLLASGVPNFLHLRTGGDHFLTTSPPWLRRATVIRRRSGVRKFEIDLRTTGYRLAKGGLRIVGVVYLQERPRRGRTGAPLLAYLKRPESSRRLTATQAYAASQPGWNPFCKSLARVASYVLYRGSHPAEQVDAIQSLLR